MITTQQIYMDINYIYTELLKIDCKNNILMALLTKMTQIFRI